MLSREYGASPSTLTREASHTRTIPSHASHPCPALLPDVPHLLGQRLLRTSSLRHSPAHVADIAEACEKAGNPNRYFKFASTSKVTFLGRELPPLPRAKENIARIKKRVSIQTVGYDKINQLRHVRFLKDAQGISEHMKKHAEIIRPKFEWSPACSKRVLSDTGCASWSNPDGGYFVSFDGLPNTAKRTVALARDAGVTMTGAGATWPYKETDPEDSNIRIAPTLPPLEELEQAMEVFVCCVKLAAVESLLA